MTLITTNKHPELKQGLIIHEATNPKGMYLADAHWVMNKQNELYYETDILQQHIKKGYIKIIS